MVKNSSRIISQFLPLLLSIVVFGCQHSSGNRSLFSTSRLWAAIENEDLDWIRSYHQSDNSFNFKSRRYQTPLRHAFELDKFNSFKLLLELGADPDFVCPDGHVVTHLSASDKNLDYLKLVMKAGGDPNGMNKCKGLSKGTPLYFAVDNYDFRGGNNHAERVKILIENGADVNKPCDYKERLPIQIAAASAEFEAVYVLLENNADILSGVPIKEFSFMASIRTKTPDINYFSPHKQRWCQKVHDWLIKNGYDPKKAVWTGERWVIEEQ